MTAVRFRLTVAPPRPAGKCTTCRKKEKLTTVAGPNCWQTFNNPWTRRRAVRAQNHCTQGTMTRYKWSKNDVIIPAAIFVTYCTTRLLALECIQCDKNEVWYSEEEHERHIELCQNGLVRPTPCSNHSHTHCIVSWYRSSESIDRVVTERKCGGIDDVTGCTLYNSKISRKVRHLFTKDHSQGAVRREASNLFVEVCSESCPGGECLNESITRRPLAMALLIPVMLLLF